MNTFMREFFEIINEYPWVTFFIFIMFIVFLDFKFRTKHWISCKYKKPEIGKLVLIYVDVEFGKIHSTVWSYDQERMADCGMIKYWMPLQYP